MAGIKGMTGQGLGGARKGAGRKKKETSVDSQTQPEISIEDVKAQIASSRQRLVAQLMARLDCDAPTLKKIYDAGVLPPSFYELDRTLVSLENKVGELARLENRRALLEMVTAKIQVINSL